MSPPGNPGISTLKRLAVALQFGLIVKRIGKVMKNEDNRGRKGYGDVALLKSKVLSSLYSAHRQFRSSASEIGYFWKSYFVV